MSEVRLGPMDKSDLTISEPRRVRDLGHLAFVASKPCLVCGRNRAHAHYLAFAQPTALGRKVSDEFTLPLCSTHHRELHRHGDERVWWTAQRIDAFQIAEDLWHTCKTAKAALRARIAINPTLMPLLRVEHREPSPTAHQCRGRRRDEPWQSAGGCASEVRHRIAS